MKCAAASNSLVQGQHEDTLQPCRQEISRLSADIVSAYVSEEIGAAYVLKVATDCQKIAKLPGQEHDTVAEYTSRLCTIV